MGAYIDINGHPTWVDERGSGAATVLLLHGGLDNCDSMLDTIGRLLGARFRLLAFDRRGHGRTADTDAPFGYAAMADETISVIGHFGGPVHLVGWSDGGIIALVVGRTRPDLVSRMVVIGANFHHEGLLTFDVDPASPVASQIVSAYVERSPDGAGHLDVVMEKTFSMFASEPTMTVDELREITAPTLVMVGDDDMVSLQHTIQLFEALPNAQLAVVPGTSHALPMEKPEETARIIEAFLLADSEPVTLMPVRRIRPA